MDVGTLESMSKSLSNVVLYLAIALIAAFTVIGLLVWFFKKDKFNDFKKYVMGITAGFALTALVVLIYIKVKSNTTDSSVDVANYLKMFYAILTTLIVAVTGGIAMLICSLFGEKPLKIAGIVTALLLAGSIIATLVVVSLYYKNDRYQEVRSLVGLIVSAVVCILILVACWFLGDKRKLNDTRSIVYGAIAMALSFALSYAKLFSLPKGGSITFASLLPLMIYCCMFGTRRGLIVCTLYGFLQALQDPWLLHPLQVLLDYPLAFGFIGVSGIFMEKGVFKNHKIVAFLLGGIIAVVLRYACHVFSGAFVFASITKYPTMGAAFGYSLAYNSFAFADMAIALVAGSFLFASKSFTATMVASSDLNKPEQTEEQLVEEDLDDVDRQIIANQESNADEKATDNAADNSADEQDKQ